MECLECSNPLDTDISDGCSCPKGYFYFDGVKDCIFKEPC